MVLRDPTTFQLVDDGANIPLDQILAGPRRAKLDFPPEEDTEVRGIGQMLPQEGAPPSGRSGLRGTGRRKGWSGLSLGAYVAYQTTGQGPNAKDLSVGKVLRNAREEQKVLVHPYEGLWEQLRKKPLYARPPKHLMGEPVTGPYLVTDQRTL